MFFFDQVGLCSISYIGNEYSTDHLCITIRDLSITFSTVVIVQDFKTVTFNVLFVYKPTFSFVLCRMKSQFNSLFILYISTAKPFSLLRGYIEVKIKK